MKIQTALKDLSYQIIWGEADQEVKEVIYDSRKAEPETVFVCMVGARIDSHDFMQEVAEKGCRLKFQRSSYKNCQKELRLSVLTVQEKLLPIFPQPDLVSRRRR